MLSIARAIVEPRKLLLIDEPTKGLAPAIVVALIECLAEIKRRGATILLVEQNFHAARELGDNVLVMDNGTIVHRGAMAALAADVRAAGAAARAEPGGASMTELAATERAAEAEARSSAGAAAGRRWRSRCCR